MKGKNRNHGRLFASVDTVGSFFTVLLIVLIIRSLIIEPFRIPSGSMLPTLEAGDFILVNKFSYGLRLPVLRYKFLDTGAPARGDVAVFKYPQNPRQDFIKRVIGLPRDVIEYRNKKIYINQIAMEYETVDTWGNEIQRWQVIEEQLFGHKHHALVYHGAYADDGIWTVPDGHYFVMGDNRDNSNDSRRWGFVPETYLLGKAFFIWFNWNWSNGSMNIQRIGTAIE